MSTESEVFPTFFSPAQEKSQGFTAYAIHVDYPECAAPAEGVIQPQYHSVSS